MQPDFVSSYVLPVPAVDHCWFSGTALRPALRLPARDLQKAAAWHNPADGAHKVVGLHSHITQLTLLNVMGGWFCLSAGRFGPLLSQQAWAPFSLLCTE